METYDDKIRYITDDGTPWIPVKGRHKIWLSFRDCSLYSLELPPVKTRDLEQLVQNQLPSLYPGDEESISYDFIRQGQRTLIFLIKKEMLQQIRRDLGEKTLIHSPGQILPSPLEEGVYILPTPLGLELMFCQKGRVDHSLNLDQQEIAQKEELLLEFSLTSEKKKNREIVLEPGSNIGGLFLEKKDRKPFLKWVGFLVSAMFLIGLFYLPLRQRILLRSQWEEFNNRMETMEQELASSTENQNHWQGPLSELQENVPADRYALLQELPEIFEGRALILYFSVKGTEIQIKARGGDALKLAEELKKVPSFKNLSLSRIERIDGEEIFTLSGELP